MTRNVGLDSIVGPKNVLQVFKRIEDVNADSSIEARGLEQPQILALVV